MKRTKIVLATVAAVAALGATALVTTPVFAHGPGWGRGGGYGMMGGPGMMGYGPDGGYGPGMMGQGAGSGHGPGMMMGYGPGAGSGPCGQDQAAGGRNLSVADVTTYLDRYLARMNNPRLKVGPVAEKDKDTIVADVVTKDGSLVWRYEFDRDTGRMTRAD